MAKKAFWLFVLIILLVPLFTGCEDSVETMYSNVNNSGVSFGDKKTGGKGEKPSVDKSKGVVVDTVVDVFREPDIKSERVTQAIFNQPVKILEDGNDWTKVKVVDGYTGWVKSKYIIRDSWSIENEGWKYKIIVTGKEKSLLSHPKGGVTIKNVVMGTEFYSNNARDGVYEVALPGKLTGWLNESGTIKVAIGAQIPKTNTIDFLSTVEKFKGTCYLWGGVSSWGLDCSGLTYIASRINGVDLPRDADEQLKCGKIVQKDDLKAGDLLFFSSEVDLKDISHVAVHIGENRFIHASKSKGYVVEGSLEESYFKNRFAGAKRLFE